MDKEFVEIFKLFKNDVFRLAFSYTKNIADTEDITQEVFVKLYNNFYLFKNEKYLKKWLMRVTINQCKTLFLSAWKRKILPMTDQEENTFYETSEIENNEILDAILKLPKKYRLVIHLYYYEDYKISEIAGILNIKETTIQTQLSRARSLLKDLLKEAWNYEE